MISFLIGGLALPGCQKMGNNRASASFDPGPTIEPAADPDYPLLQSVPPRPQLSYTVQQQREIVEALIADREHARHTSEVVRYRSGLSSLPPPPSPPEPAPTRIEAAIAAPDRAAPQPGLAEHDTLIDFLNVLLFGGPEDPEIAGEPEARDETSDEADTQEQAEPSDAAAGQAHLPPARSAVAARLAAGPGVIDALVDPTVPQAPLPPGQSGPAARGAAAEDIEVAAPTAVRLPARRPTMVGATNAALPASLPTPPPLKPIVPTDASAPPRPVEKPVDPRSAADDTGAHESPSAGRLLRAALPLANAAS